MTKCLHALSLSRDSTTVSPTWRGWISEYCSQAPSFKRKYCKPRGGQSYLGMTNRTVDWQMKRCSTLKRPQWKSRHSITKYHTELFYWDKYILHQNIHLWDRRKSTCTCSVHELCAWHGHGVVQPGLELIFCLICMLVCLDIVRLLQPRKDI